MDTLRIDPSKLQRVPAPLDLAHQPVSQAELAIVIKNLSATAAELARTRDDLAKLQTEVTIYKKIAEILTDRANASDARFQHHTHQYNYKGVDFTTKWFVTSGRPIAKDEKKDYATVITSTPNYLGETTVPLTKK